jgi:lipoate-protein ligase A
VNNPFFVIDSGVRESAFNMALDEVLLKAMPGLGVPVLRFYGWSEPAATFGYFQQYATVAALTTLRPLIRRPTGGGIVPHDADWTYSLAFPDTHEWYSLKAVGSYRRIHEWIQRAFAHVQVTTELAPEKLQTSPGQCFAGYEQFDLLLRGRKIAGAAQRRSREGLLIQGSIQPPRGPKRAHWQQAMLAIGEQDGYTWRECVDLPRLEAEASLLALSKYGRDEFNRKK